MLVFGTRPEAIKMAPLVKEFEKHPEQFQTIVCVTAQHREMLDQVLQLFEISPDYDLNIMKDGQDLYDVTSRVLLGMRDVLKASRPDVVLVHGDTSTSTAAALAAFYQKIPVGHIEAGLRTYNIYSPWPEEMNRQITTRIATYHFAPTSLSKQNLLLENVSEGKIHITGNTVIDALYWVIERLENDPSLNEKITNQLIEFGLPQNKIDAWHSSVQYSSIIPQTSIKSRKLVLITGHRRENYGNGFLNICEAIKELANTFSDVDFVYPMHLNPNVRNAIKQVFGPLRDINLDSYNSRTIKHLINNIQKKQYPENLYFIEPLDYLPFVALMKNSYLVLTDSGGIQEEAPGLGKPVLVMRDTSERQEALDAGTVRLVGTDKSLIINEVSELINNIEYYNNMAKANNPFGDGKASKRIRNLMN